MMGPMEELHKMLGRDFVKVPKHGITRLDSTHLIVLAVLLDRDAFKARLSREVDFVDYPGYFKYSGQQMEADTNMSLDRQSKTLRRIAELGYITVFKKGMPPSRCIRLNYGKIYELFFGTNV